MGELEDRIKYDLNQALLSSESVMKAATGGPQKTDPITMLFEVVLPLLNAQRAAILSLAREIDELRGT